MECEVIRSNKHQVLKVIQFDHNSYYAIKLMDCVVREEIPGSHIKIMCPLLLEGFSDVWYPLVYTNGGTKEGL